MVATARRHRARPHRTALSRLGSQHARSEPCLQAGRSALATWRLSSHAPRWPRSMAPEPNPRQHGGPGDPVTPRTASTLHADGHVRESSDEPASPVFAALLDDPVRKASGGRHKNRHSRRAGKRRAGQCHAGPRGHCQSGRRAGRGLLLRKRASIRARSPSDVSASRSPPTQFSAGVLDVARRRHLGDGFGRDGFALSIADYHVADEGVRLGFRPDNPVNPVSAHGVQVERSSGLRGIGDFGEIPVPRQERPGRPK